MSEDKVFGMFVDTKIRFKLYTDDKGVGMFIFSYVWHRCLKKFYISNIYKLPEIWDFPDNPFFFKISKKVVAYSKKYVKQAILGMKFGKI